MNTGFIRLDKGAYITPADGHGIEVEVPTWAFFITDGKRKILVDTGMSKTEKADWHHRGSYQPEGFRIDERLRKLGVGPGEINAVLFTHLHWDHCSNMKLFSNAKYYVHTRELAFARNPHVLFYKSYESRKLGVVPPFEGVEFQVVDGEFRYNDFLTLFPTPGHCPGHQSVEVKTDQGVYIIAGDAVFADENLKPDKHRNLPFTPMGRYVNVFEMFTSMEAIFARADHILPGHATSVSCKDVYP
jgi:glyoxylase-like metal-dependent hydrolase (beta-lactamase superfamily II)